MTASSRAVASAGAQEPSGALFRLMAEQWPHPILLLDRALRVRWVNPTAATWLDAPSRDALVGKSWSDLSLPWAVDSDAFRDAIAGRFAKLPEAMRVTSSRERRLCRGQLVALKDSSGAAGSILCLIEDLSLTVDTTAGMPSLAVLAAGAPVSDTQRQLALSSAQVGAWHWDFDAGYFAVDSRWCKAINVDPCTGLEHVERWEREIHPDDVVEFRRRRAEIEAGRADRFEVEYRILTGDSRWLWILQRGRTLEHRTDGRAARVTGICIDIDDRKRAEVTLQENESRLATALWGARAAFWQWHIPTDTSIMSPLWFAMTGYTREQWEGIADPWTTRVHPEDRPQLAQRIRAHLQGEAQSIEVEYRIRTASGEYKWMLMRGRVVEWDFDGKATSAIGVSLDIDAQKRAELALLTSEARLETAVWGAGMGLWELDFRTERTRWFSDWCDRLDIEPCDGADHVARWDANLHPDDLPDAARRFADHVAGKEDYYDAEYRIHTRTGEWRWLFERGRVVERASDGNALRMVGVCMDIDARKAAEILAGKNQRRLEVALESARGGMWDWDLVRDSVQATDYFYRMLGYAPGHTHDQQGFWRSLIHPDDRERAESALAAVIEARAELYEAEYRLKHSDGSWRWVLDRARVTERDNEGRAQRVVGFIVDVTDRVQTQEALRQSEFRYRTIAQVVPGYVSEVRIAEDGTSDTIWVSEGLQSVLGLTLEEFLQRGGIDAFVDPGWLDGVRARRKRVLQGEAQVGELLVHTAAGEQKYLQVSMAPVRDPQTGRITGAIGSAHDITTRKLAEEALRSSEAVLRGVTENTPDWLFLLDEQFHVRFLNRGFLNWRVEEVIGRNLLDLAPEDARPGAEALWKEVFATSKPGRSEFRCLAPDGRTFYYDYRVVPVLDGGRVRTITVAVTDVTERVLAQQAIMNDVKERKRLEREIIEIANREQQRIGSDLHDGLGQDLTGIALMLRGIVAQLRKESSGTRHDVEDVINLVNNAIESTRALARGLSPVSAEQGGLPAALQALAARAGERYGIHVHLRTDLARPLQLDETTATHLYRIAQEALTNVVRHSRATSVSIDLRLAHDLLELGVGDDGRGFSDTDEANGLGLKIMRYRAQMLGGDLLLEDRPEGGALVRCVCPLPPAKSETPTGRHRRVPS